MLRQFAAEHKGDAIASCDRVGAPCGARHCAVGLHTQKQLAEAIGALGIKLSREELRPVAEVTPADRLAGRR